MGGVNCPNLGPSFLQIGTEGGFLPQPTVRAPQPVTYITDPTAFWVGIVDKTGSGTRPRRACRRHRRFQPVCRQDPDPLQRRSGCLAGPRTRLRLLHRRTRHARFRRLRHRRHLGSDHRTPGQVAPAAARLRPEHPHRHAGHRPADCRHDPAYPSTRQLSKPSSARCARHDVSQTGQIPITVGPVGPRLCSSGHRIRSSSVRQRTAPPIPTRTSRPTTPGKA
ncbi:MAG: hypothetical protein MZW92_17465 [Comamonadaceae bacterium]|nr:hypothetical protein [Comamonadaceae bacterium]